MLEPVHLAIILSVISVVAWAVRIESKASKATDDITLLRKNFDDHATNAEIHHNNAFFSEFEKRIDERFVHLNQSIDKVEKFVEDIDSKIERYLNEQ